MVSFSVTLLVVEGFAPFCRASSSVMSGTSLVLNCRVQRQIEKIDSGARLDEKLAAFLADQDNFAPVEVELCTRVSPADWC